MAGSKDEDEMVNGTHSHGLITPLSEDDPGQQYHRRQQDIESSESSDSKGSSSLGMCRRLDSKGLPLVPQPSRFKDDPLVSTCTSYMASYILQILRTKHIPFPILSADASRTGPHR